MPKFQDGDLANAMSRNGKKVKVRIVNQQHNGSYVVQVYDENNHVEDRHELVKADRFLPPRGPYFDVRGEVSTTSLAHPSEAGEINNIGTNETASCILSCTVRDRGSLVEGRAEWSHPLSSGLAHRFFADTR